MIRTSFIALTLLAALQASPACAASCAPDALGATEREIKVGGPIAVGLKTYPRTLELADHEVVLTFDDGPMPSTARVLDALAAECAKATFFLIGRNAAAHRPLVQREIALGHTVGSHSQSHPARTLRSLSAADALKDIDDGVASVAKAAGQPPKFFRFPGFGDTPVLLDALARRNVPVFGADLWASDWNEQTPEEELNLVMTRLRHSGGGILLLHDTRPQTAAMLPDLLKALKAEHFRLVHLIAGDKPPAMRAAPDGWRSQTDATLRAMGVSMGADEAGPAAPGEGVPARAQDEPARPEDAPTPATGASGNPR